MASRRLSELVYAVGQGVGLHMIDPFRPLGALFDESYSTASLWPSPRTASVLQTFLRSLERLRSWQCPTCLQVRLCYATRLARPSAFCLLVKTRRRVDPLGVASETGKVSHSSHLVTFIGRLRHEHDSVFGRDPFSALQALLSGTCVESEYTIISKLPYTVGFMKMSLRSHPPAATVRAVPETATLVTLDPVPAVCGHC